MTLVGFLIEQSANTTDRTQIWVALIGGCVTVITALIALKLNHDLKLVSRSVNHQPKDAPTLLARVRFLEQGQDWERKALTTIAETVGCTLPKIPERRAKPRPPPPPT